MSRTKTKAADLMAGKSVLAQHAQLREEHAAAHAADHEERRNVLRHEQAAERFNEQRMALYRQKARGVLEGLAELNEAERGWSNARRQAADAQEQAEAARAAITAVDREIAALYEQHLSVFAAEAEKYTQEAAKALAALQEPYAAAWQAWHRAMQAWQPLQAAIYEAGQTADQTDGVFRDRSQAHRDAQCPALPLPQPGFLGGIPAPRPPAMQPARPADPLQNSAA